MYNLLNHAWHRAVALLGLVFCYFPLYENLDLVNLQDRGGEVVNLATLLSIFRSLENSFPLGYDCC